MTNFQVYRKTLSFSFVIFLFDLLALALVVGGATGGYFILANKGSWSLLGLVLGAVVGAILATVLGMFTSNRVKAAQITMMTRGVADDELPEHVYKAGMDSVKGRFGKITAFFFITSAIKGVFREIGRAMTRIGQAVGGDVGGGIAGAIDSAVQTLIGYLCDCCLGWVLYHQEKNAFKAACEGAVIFFKHGKALIRNVGRIFGMGILSFIVVGGAFFGISYFAFTAFPAMFEQLALQIKQLVQSGEGSFPEWLYDPKILMIVVAAILGIVAWSILHSVLIRPFILVGVLRNYMAAGKANQPSESDFAELESRCPKFAKLRKKAEE